MPFPKVIVGLWPISARSRREFIFIIYFDLKYGWVKAAMYFRLRSFGAANRSFGGPSGPHPTAKLLGKGGGLRPPPSPMGFAVGRGRKTSIVEALRPPPTAKPIGKSGGGFAPHLFQWVLR